VFISSVKTQEASGPKGRFGLFGKTYTLAITVIIDDSHPLDKEMRIINEHYVNWLKRRGKDCRDLIFAFTAPPHSDDAILSQCRRLLMQDAGDKKALAAMEIDVVIVDAETQVDTHYKLKWDPNAQPSVAAPSTKASTDAAILVISGPAPGQETLLLAEDDPLTAAIEEARRRIPEFKELLDSPQAGVTVRVPWVCGDIRDIYEAVVVGRNEDKLEVEFTPDYAPGPVRKTYGLGEILDWTVHHENGQKSGGFTTRANAAEGKQTSPPQLEA